MLKMIKLVTGEVVIGKTDDSVSPEELTLLKPMLLMLDPVQGGVGMIPYDIVYTQQEPKTKTFAKVHIMDDNLNIDKSFEDAYISQTTGIEIPDAGIDLPEIILED